MPSATRPNLTAEPSSARAAPGRPAIKASVLASPCERLTATVHGAPRGGQGPVRIGSASGTLARSVSRSAPRPTMPRPDDPEQRGALGHQRQIDGEFVAAGDEFLGAVERVDQEEAVFEGQPRPPAALLVKRARGRGQP